MGVASAAPSTPVSLTMGNISAAAGLLYQWLLYLSLLPTPFLCTHSHIAIGRRVPFSLVLVSLTAKGLLQISRPLAVKVGIWVLKARAKGLETYCGSHGSSHLATVTVFR